MFPTLSHLLQYLFGIQIQLPIQTFGFFMALSFVGAYFVFVSEFKRKEKEGLISAQKVTVTLGQPASLLELLVNGLLGFIGGYKIVSILFNYTEFIFDPKAYLISLRGNVITGLVCGAALAWWAYSDRKKAIKDKPVKVEEVIHPYQLMTLIVFSVAFWGFIGAKLFDCLEHWDQFLANPAEQFFSLNGLTYYGGLVFGALSYLYIGYNRGMKLSHLADIGSPGMMLAYGVGRIGCHLAGDGDWGIINNHIRPGWLSWVPDWAWSFKFPHNVINAGNYIPGCYGDYCYQLAHGVYPTSFYEATLCLLIFGFLWAIRKHLHVGCLMFCIFLILNGTERILIESIRVNPKYHLFNMAFTQAELICALMITGGIIGLAIIGYKHKHSSNQGAKAV